MDDLISREAVYMANEHLKPCSPKDVEDMISCIPSAQRWIPCSERLPKEYGNYLITTHNGDVDVGTIDPKKKGVWSACDADGFYWIREVVAWMPLPKPYKEDDHETD